MDGSEGGSGGKGSSYVAALSVEPTFFKDVSYWMSGSIDPQLLRLLETGGGKKTNFAGVGTTHVFAGEGADKIKIEEAQEVFEVPVVSPLWILACASLKRILPLDGFNGGCNQLFSNICVTSSGIRRKDKSYIWSMITFYGGKFTQRLTNECTHLVTISTTPTLKYQNAKRLGLKVVTPDWIYQCVVKNAVSEERMFDPELLIAPYKEAQNEEVLVKVETKPPTVTNVLTTATKGITLNDSSKSLSSVSNILQNKLLSQPQQIRIRAPGDVSVNQVRMVHINQTRMQQPVLTPTMQQQLQNASTKSLPSAVQQIRLPHSGNESQNLNDGQQRYIQWQQQNKQQPAPNISSAQQSQLQVVQGQLQQQQQMMRNNASPAPLGSQQTIQNQQGLQGQHPIQPSQNQQQLLQGHPQQTHHQIQPQNIQQQLNQPQLHQQGNSQQIQMPNSHQVHQGQIPNQQQGPQQQQMRQVTQMQQPQGFQQMGQMQPPGHIPSQHPQQHQNQQQLQNVQQMHSPQHLQSSQKLQSPQQLQSPVHQQMQSPVHQQMQSPVHQHIQSPVHQQMLSPSPQQLQNQVPQQMQGQITQQMQGQMPQQMPGQVSQQMQNQMPQQMQGQVPQQIQGQIPQQMQGQVPQQMQGQVPQQMQGQVPQQIQGQIPQQMQGQIPQQMQGQVPQQMQGQVPQQMQGQVPQQMQGQIPQQMQGQVPQQMQGQVPQHMQNQVGQIPQQMQGQVGQIPQQMQGQVGQIPPQMQGQVGQIAQQMQGQGGQLPQQMQGQTGQLSQQMQGQTGQLSQQMQGQGGQLPQQMQGQVGQIPQQMQNQVGQIPQQLQNQVGQIPQQMQSQVGQISQQLQGQIPQQMQNQLPQSMQSQIPQQMQGQVPQQLQGQQLQSQVPPQIQSNQQNQFQQGQIQFQQSQNMQQLQFQNQNQVRAQQQRQFNPSQVQQQQQIRVALPVSSKNQQIHFQVVQQQPNRPQMMINQGIPRGQYQPQGNVTSPNNPMNQQQVYRQQQPNQIQLFHPIQQGHRMQSPDQQQQHTGNQLQANPNQLQQNTMNQGQLHQIPGHYNVVINQFSPNSPNAHQQVNNPQIGQPQHQQLPQGQTVQYARPSPWTPQHTDIVRQAQSDPEFAAKWNNMDHEQRTLFLQQLMQTRKNESMRQEMMQRQQQMQQSGNAPQPPQPVGVGQSPQRPVLGSPQSTMGSPNQNLSIQQQNMQQSHVGQAHGDKQLNHVSPQNSSPSGQVTMLGNIQQTQGPIGSQPQQMILQGHQLQKTAPGVSPGQAVQVQNPPNQQTVLGSQPSPGTTQQKQFLPPQIQSRLAPHGYIGSQQGSPQVVGVVRTQIYTPQVGQQQQRVNIRHGMQQQQPPGQQPRQHLVVQHPGPGPTKMAIMTPGQQQQGHLPQQPNSLHWSPNQRMVSPGKPTQFQSRLQSPDQMTTSPQQTSWNIRPQNPSPLSPSGPQPTMSYVQVVNSKTKTALANLLSNRLQGSAVPESNAVPTTSASTTSTVLSSTTTTQAMCPPPPPPVTSQSLSQTAPATAQTNVVLERRTLANITNGSKTIQVNTFGSPRVPTSQIANSSTTTPPRPQFYGHDPQQSIPPEKFLLGCVFWQAETSHMVQSLSTAIFQYGGELVKEYSSATVTHVLCETQAFKEFAQVMRDGKRVVTLHWLNDICNRKMLLPPYYAIHLPVPFKFKEDVSEKRQEPPLRNHVFSTTGFNNEDRRRVIQMLKLLGAEHTVHFSQFNTALVAFRAEGHKYTKAREYKRPIVCVQLLNELMLGHTFVLPMMHSPKYQNFTVDQPFRFDINLSLGLMAPWKNPIRVNTEQIERAKLKRRSEGDEESSSPKMSNLELDDEAVSPLGMDAQQSNCETEQEAELSIWKPIVIISGFTNGYKEKIKSKIEQLGGKVTTDVKEATHLLLKANYYTFKLFYAICRMRHVVDISWVTASLAANKFVDEKAHVAVHKPFEETYKVNLADLMMKSSRRSLFKDMTFHITPSFCAKTRKNFINLIGCAGGTALMVRHWKVRDTLSRFPKKNILITCAKDYKIMHGHLGKARRPHLVNVCFEEDIWYWIATQKITLKSDTIASQKKSALMSTPEISASDLSSAITSGCNSMTISKPLPDKVTDKVSSRIVESASVNVNGCSTSRPSALSSTSFSSTVPKSSNNANQNDSPPLPTSASSLSGNNNLTNKGSVTPSVSTASSLLAVSAEDFSSTGCEQPMEVGEDSRLS